MLKYKLFKWFGVLTLVFGALAATMGILVINQRTVQEAQTRVRYDLSSAWAVYQSQLRAIETTVRLTAVRGPLVEACAAQNWQDPQVADELKGLLSKVRSDFGLDFIAVVSPEGRVLIRASPPYSDGDCRSSEPVIAKALAGAAAVATVVLSRDELMRETDSLADRAFLSLQETPRARTTPRTSEDRGMVMLAAAPVERNGRVLGAIYGGVLLNRNNAFVDRVQEIVFGQEKYADMPIGTVTLFLGDTRIATTVRLANGNRAMGTRVSREVADRVLDNAGSWLDRAFVVNDWYLTAYDPVRDSRGEVVGMLYVGALERPFRDLSRSMVIRYSLLVGAALLAALLLAMIIAGRIAGPLHRLAESAKRVEHGHGFEPVAGSGGCEETASLIHAFNNMAEALTDREQQLRAANEQLAGANSSLKATNAQYVETLQFVSHELNSPLASITNYASMHRQRLLGPITEKQEGALEVMSANLKRVMEMIRHYLNLARIETGELQPTPTRVAVRDDVLAPILASLGNDIQAKNLRVEDLIDPKLTLHSDMNQTRELFENLLGNAVKYGSAGGLITLSCAVHDGRAEFSIRNEGEGIPPERRSELFQKFSRLEMGDQRKAPRGTGLGLFICKKIVEAHGGTISADSQVGRWTEFRCTLPLAREQENTAATKANKDEPSVRREVPVAGEPVPMSGR